MDAGITDTINRRDAALVAQKLDSLDREFGNATPWYRIALADDVVTGNITPDRVWHFTILASGTVGIAFDGAPADADWDNLFTHFRAEIAARRDPETHLAHEAEVPVPGGVGSR